MLDFDHEVKNLVDHFLKAKIYLTPSCRETWLPAADVYMKHHRVMVKIELPGVDARDIHIRVEGSNLIVHGIRKDRDKSERLAYYQMEIDYGHFQRTIRLPARPAKNDISAKYRNGFLEIEVPVAGAVREKDLR